MKSLLNRPTLKNVALPILVDLKYVNDGGYILAGTASSIDSDASGRHGVRGNAPKVISGYLTQLSRFKVRWDHPGGEAKLIGIKRKRK
jgi:hypothetical protein